jgi:outer membrane scaffolding protein for murein synthesis (MipA/OmpV family)
MATHSCGWRQTLAFGLALCGCGASVSGAVDRPLWEFGLGAGAIAFTDYRGADSAHVFPLPIPYFVYRGKLFRADRDGVRGMLIKNPRAELNVSVDATTPVSSRNNSARAGMPDLKPTIEFGPSLDVHLWRSRNERLRLDLRVPVRKAFTIERQPQSVGWFVAPRINLDLRDIAGHAGWDVGMLIGPLFADRQYHNYFYSVAPSFATPGRPAYQAAGGYSGAELLAATSRRQGNFWIGAFVRYDSLAGAQFVASPLVRSRSYWAGGFGIARIIGRSERQVTGDN